MNKSVVIDPICDSIPFRYIPLSINTVARIYIYFRTWYIASTYTPTYRSTYIDNKTGTGNTIFC